jgi:hypothetical protein
MEKIVLWLGGLAVLFAADMFFAQATVLALSTYGVHSGIWAPFILESVAAAVIGTGVVYGMRASK